LTSSAQRVVTVLAVLWAVVVTTAYATREFGATPVLQSEPRSSPPELANATSELAQATEALLQVARSLEAAERPDAAPRQAVTASEATAPIGPDDLEARVLEILARHKPKSDGQSVSLGSERFTPTVPEAEVRNRWSTSEEASEELVLGSPADVLRILGRPDEVYVMQVATGVVWRYSWGRVDFVNGYVGSVHLDRN